MLEQIFVYNLPRSLLPDLTLLIILLLIRNSSNKLHSIMTLKRLYLFWIPYWLIHGIFYLNPLGKTMSLINGVAVVLLFIPLVFIIIIRKILKKYKEKKSVKKLSLD